MMPKTRNSSPKDVTPTPILFQRDIQCPEAISTLKTEPSWYARKFLYALLLVCQPHSFCVFTAWREEESWIKLAIDVIEKSLKREKGKHELERSSWFTKATWRTCLVSDLLLTDNIKRTVAVTYSLSCKALRTRHINPGGISILRTSRKLYEQHEALEERQPFRGWTMQNQYEGQLFLLVDQQRNAPISTSIWLHAVNTPGFKAL